MPDAREIECAVLGNDAPEASVPGEIIPSREFYDYEAKYLDDDSRTVIPAELSAAQTAEVRRLAIEVFRAVDGAGMARVDFLMDGKTGKALRQRDQHHSRLHDHQHVFRRCGRPAACPIPPCSTGSSRSPRNGTPTSSNSARAL